MPVESLKVVPPGLIRWLSADLSELREAAGVLAAAESSTGVVVHNDQGAIAAANGHAAQLLGLSWDQLIGVTSMDPRWQVVSESGLPMPGEQHPAMVALRAGQPVTSCLMGVLIPTDGSTVWLDVTAHPLRRDEQVIGAIVFFRDVSESARGRAAYSALISAYRLLAENASDIVMRVALDGTCLWISPSVQNATGWRADHLIGHNYADLAHPQDLDQLLANRRAIFQGKGAQHYYARLRCADGAYRWFWASVQLENAAGSLAQDGAPDIPQTTIVSLRDVDEQILAREELAASERHYRLLAENSSDVIMHMRQDCVVWVSPGVEPVLGWVPDQLLGAVVGNLVHPDDAEAAAQLVAVAPQMPGDNGLRQTVRWMRPDGSTLWCDVAARPFLEDGTPDGVVLRLRDVSVDVESRGRLEYQARHDQLTGLANRQQLSEQLAALLALPGAGPALAVAFCDIDHFKLVNDTYGHDSGDRLLREVADRISATVRSGDVVARLGGDEFVVVLVGVRELGEALAVAETIRAAVARSVSGGGDAVTLSIGVSLALPGDDVDRLVARADDAVYLAKERGRDCVAALDVESSHEPKRSTSR